MLFVFVRPSQKDDKGKGKDNKIFQKNVHVGKFKQETIRLYKITCLNNIYSHINQIHTNFIYI